MPGDYINLSRQGGAKPNQPVTTTIQGQANPLRPATPSPTPAAPPVYSGGGGGGAIAAPAPTPAPAPAPITDKDWFNSDPVYRGAAGQALNALTGQLAQILAARDTGYQQLGNNELELGQQKTQDFNDNANDFAGRGLLQSGLFAQSADQLGQDYANQQGQMDQQEQQLQQQYGKQGTKVDLSGVNGGNGLNNLSSLYGLLGSMGLQAGQTYNTAVGQAKAASAGRATQPLVQTVSWG